MSDRGKKIAAVMMLIAGTALMFINRLWSVSDEYSIYRASGRQPAAPETIMPSGSVSINEAEAEELTELYGIGETLAALIIDEREKNGRYWYPEDLTAVKGIGIKKVDGFRDSINLD